MNDGERTVVAIQKAEGKRLMYKDPLAEGAYTDVREQKEGGEQLEVQRFGIGPILGCAGRRPAHGEQDGIMERRDDETRQEARRERRREDQRRRGR